VLLALAASTTAAAAPPHAACPPVAGTIEYATGTQEHALALRSCTDQVTGTARERRSVPGVRAVGRGSGVVRLYVHDRLVFEHWETGPLVPMLASRDGRWVFFFVDEYGSASGIADGTPMYVVSTRGGAVHDLGRMLPDPDYLTWCGGEVVYTPGTDRVAIDGKRLVAAGPPDWRPRELWHDPARTFATPACEPRRNAIAVLTQHTSTVAKFFATRWRLWRVGLNGSRHVLDVPPPGWADEEPTWSPDGDSLLFVRERNGYGRLMLLHDRTLFGPLANLGYSLGYYGHHEWGIAWRR
jgi:hypothetical protein